MLNKQLKKIKSGEVDYILIIIIIVILIFGLVSLSTASVVVAYNNFGDAYYYFKHQLFGLSLGLIAFVFFSKTNYHVWKKYGFGFLIFSIILLLLVFIPGLSASYGKARSWIVVFGFSLQPSEFVKLSFLLFLSSWLETRKKDLHDIYEGFGPFIIMLGIVSLLMILQPDIGTLAIISITSLIVYFVGGGDIKHIVLIILIGILIVFSMILYKPYLKNRFVCMINPAYSTNDICYQTNQSLIAVGSGGFLGRGLGQSRQKFMYLPEVSGDSIFAIIAEESGMLVSTILIFLYFAIFYRGIKIAKTAPDDFGRILAIGIVVWLMIQVIINIGGIINILPMTGVTLPLISYGGSSILVTLSALGVLVNISKYSKR
ncbi:putative lipid II flippase FtsW [Candidatus Parcubacteria bacterium]|nr:putative lipid II flippase FtsW [Candidatus Parcubacteria bacterium]